MPVITRCEVGINALQKFNGWLVIRVLWYEFTMNGEVEDFTLGLFDCSLQIRFSIFNDVNQRKPLFNFIYDAVLFGKWWKRK